MVALNMLLSIYQNALNRSNNIQIKYHDYNDKIWFLYSQVLKKQNTNDSERRRKQIADQYIDQSTALGES